MVSKLCAHIEFPHPNTGEMQHINDLEILRQNISLVGYGQKDPAIVYKLKAFDMFNKMSDDIKNDAVYTLFSSRLRTAAPKRDTAA